MQNAIYKKGTQLSSFSIYTRIKAGNARTNAPKESIYKKGWRNMNRYSLFDVLKWGAIIVQQSTQHFKQ